MGEITPLNELDVLTNHKKYDKKIVLDLMQRIMNEPEPEKKFSDKILIAAARIITDASIKTADEAIAAIKKLTL